MRGALWALVGTGLGLMPRAALRVMSLVWGCVVLLLAGCATTAMRDAVPLALLDQASVKGIPDARFWGDAVSSGLDRSLSTRIDQIIATRGIAELKPGTSVDVSFLALSGGGGDGAFGAGLLNGWTAHGNRPDFEIVTGVSTGALLAPFAFLGSAYDEQVKQMYTNVSTKQLASAQVLSALFGGDAVADNSNLAAQIERYLTRDVFDAIAVEHSRGRRLFVATTNLDAERQVIWDMGAIAAAGTGEALVLFRRVLLASAAVPGIFSPVRLTVNADGRTYEELHVDGGTTGQVFFLPVNAVLSDYARGRINLKVRRHLYVVRNTKVAPQWMKVEGKAFSIVERSLATLTKNQGVGDLYKLYVEARRQDIDFNYAAIPPTFDRVSREPFDTDYMQALFAMGLELGRHGYPWSKTPPGLEEQPQAKPSRGASSR